MPAKPAACRPRSVHGRGLSGSSTSRTPGRDSRHAAVEAELLPRRRPPRRPRHPARRTPIRAAAGRSGSSADRGPAEGHRVPGDEPLGRRTVTVTGSGSGLARKATSSPVDPPADPQHLGAVHRRASGRSPSPSSAAARSSVSSDAVRRPRAGRTGARARRRRRPATASRPDAVRRRWRPPRPEPASRRSARTVIRELLPPRYSSRYRGVPRRHEPPSTTRIRCSRASRST